LFICSLTMNNKKGTLQLNVKVCLILYLFRFDYRVIAITRGSVSTYVFYKLIKIPASAALIKLASVAANTALKPKLATSERRSGAITPIEPI